MLVQRDGIVKEIPECQWMSYKSRGFVKAPEKPIQADKPTKKAPAEKKMASE